MSLPLAINGVSLLLYILWLLVIWQKFRTDERWRSWARHIRIFVALSVTVAPLLLWYNLYSIAKPIPHDPAQDEPYKTRLSQRVNRATVTYYALNYRIIYSHIEKILPNGEHNEGDYPAFTYRQLKSADAGLPLCLQNMRNAAVKMHLNVDAYLRANTDYMTRCVNFVARRTAP